MKKKIALTVLTLVLGLGRPVSAEDLSLESAPPVVVKTVPVAGEINVDPGLTELRVTFSKPMSGQSWSWDQHAGLAYPEMVDAPRWSEDKRSLVRTIRLEPAKVYGIWLNRDGKPGGIEDKRGIPAVPYLLTFNTAGAAMDHAATVSEALSTISQCAEGDPRVAAALKRLETVPTAKLVVALVPYLDSTTDTIRRSAIYVLWRGNLADISPAAPALKKLLNHSEDITRGMAALALGQNRVAGCLEPLILVTRDDKSAYARRCGAYALGLLGDPKAKGALEAALKDSETPVRKNAEAALKMLEQVKPAEPPPTKAAAPTVPAPPNNALLNDNQRAVLAWTDRQFGSFFDGRSFDGWSEQERADLEKRSLDALKGPRSTEYYQAIGTLAALQSTNALPALRGIAFERVDGNNRNRWMCVRALGLKGDKASVPDLIHLVYHGNQNTHWWAQISLVRLTGQNFGGDWNAWGRWWNENNGQPTFSPEIIRWWDGQAGPDKLAGSLVEGDKMFLDGLGR